MFGIHFRADLQLFTWPNIAESHMDANTCNRECKRLQPRLQTFASGNSYTHLPGEMPSADHLFRLRWAHGRALWSEIWDIKQLQNACSSASEVRQNGFHRGIFCTKWTECARFLPLWEGRTEGLRLSYSKRIGHSACIMSPGRTEGETSTRRDRDALLPHHT